MSQERNERGAIFDTICQAKENNSYMNWLLGYADITFYKTFVLCQGEFRKPLSGNNNKSIHGTYAGEGWCVKTEETKNDFTQYFFVCAGLNNGWGEKRMSQKSFSFVELLEFVIIVKDRLEINSLWSLFSTPSHNTNSKPRKSVSEG